MRLSIPVLDASPAWISYALLLCASIGFMSSSALASEQPLAESQTSADQHLAVVELDRLQVAEPDMTGWDRKRIAGYKAARADSSPPDAILRVPRLKVSVPIFEGTSDHTLNLGAGRIEGTASLEDGSGNVGLAAHRDGFFRPLKDIQVGDALYVDSRSSRRVYRVSKVWIVEPDNVDVLSATDHSSITLVTCYPFYFVGSAPQRFIVQAREEQRAMVSDGE
ncbi:MAG: class D sortase [Povalibacter sp.]